MITAANQESDDGRYRILEQLGEGGRAVVYLATDTRLHRRVALKAIRKERADAPAASRELEREAAAMTRASNPRLCAVYDLTEWHGRPGLVMERLEGCTLQARLATGRLANAELLDIAEQIVEALEAVHGAGLIHQDIKPSNVFVTTSGLVKLLDFGLAEACDGLTRDHASRHRAVRTSVFGTASYIAPERILRHPVDYRADLFSFGAVVYEMATGRQPFAGASAADALFNVLMSTPAIDAKAAGRPVQLDRLLRKLLAKSPEERWRSATEVRQHLVNMRGGESSHRPGHVRRSFRRGIHHASNSLDDTRCQ